LGHGSGVYSVRVPVYGADGKLQMKRVQMTDGIFADGSSKLFTFQKAIHRK
jgi:hypothetical protein